MNLITSTIAAVSTTAILSGSAQAQSPLDDMIATLRLPVGTPTQYYNAATQSVLQETCNIVDARHVACDVRVLGAAAIVDFTQRGMVYKIGDDGKITVDPGEFDQETWDTEVDGGLYRKLMKQGGAQASWTASSPLARAAADGTVIQNNIRETALIGDRAYAKSNVPISENRGIILTQSFEDRSPAHLQIEMKIVQNGAVVSAVGGTASRPFIESDYKEYVVKYYNESLKPYAIAAP
jgi:hypothetical protein